MESDECPYYPHPPAPEPRTVEHMQSAYAHGKMDGERTATLATLDKLEIWAHEATKESKDKWGQIPYGWILNELESLRQTAGGAAMNKKCESCRWTYEDVQEGAMMPRRCDWYEVCIYEPKKQEHP
jgi:hypothetical protein